MHAYWTIETAFLVPKAVLETLVNFLLFSEMVMTS